VGLKAKMFNRKASDPRNKPDQILETLALQNGQHVADVGSGGGYFSLRFARAVGEGGRVFAIDTDHELLELIKQSAEEKGLKNVSTVLATEKWLNLPEKGIDLVFMRNMTHHLQDRVDYFRRVKRFLKPRGRIAIIEYKRTGGGFTFRRIFGHNVPKETIIEEMRKAGYSLEEDLDFLPEQSFTIYSLKT
jgi:arsenite methyltransferase